MFSVNRPSEVLVFELLCDGHEAHLVLLKQAEHLGEIEQRPAQAINLVNHHAIQFSRCDRLVQPPQCGPVHVGASEAAIVIAIRECEPAFALSAQNESFTRLALCSERVELLIETLLCRFPSVDGAAQAGWRNGRLPFHLTLPHGAALSAVC